MSFPFINRILFNTFQKYQPVLFCCVLMLAACSKKKEQDRNTFYINYSSGALESMDPAYAKDLYMMWTDHMLYNTLVETDTDLRTVPCLAKSWEISDDGLQYTFHLRTDVYFQDNEAFKGGKGRLMNAADVAYSFNRIIDPAVASPGAWIFNDRVAEENAFTATDDSTFQLRLRAPFRPMIQILTMQYCSVVPKEVVEHWGKDYRSHPCGTGPFMFHYWDEGNVLVLKRNPHYWQYDNAGKQLPYVDAVQVSFVDSKATEFLLFLQGKIDFVNGIDGSFKDLLLKKDGTLKPEFTKRFRLEKQLYLNTEYIGFLTDTANPVMKNAPTRSVKVRQAINYAIDRQRIVTYFRNGIVAPAANGFIPAGMPGYDAHAAYGYSYNPQKALQLLAEAGYPEGKGLPVLNIIVPDNWADVVNYIAAALKDVGIQVQAEIVQANIMRQQMSRSQAMAFRGQWIADYPDAESYMAFFNSRFPAPPNYTRFADATFDRWYDESTNMPDTLRWQQYRKMDSLVMSKAPVIPLFYDRLLHFTQNNISGFSSNAMNIIDVQRVKKQN